MGNGLAGPQMCRFQLTMDGLEDWSPKFFVKLDIPSAQAARVSSHYESRQSRSHSFTHTTNLNTCEFSRTAAYLFIYLLIFTISNLIRLSNGQVWTCKFFDIDKYKIRQGKLTRNPSKLMAHIFSSSSADP